MGVIISLDEAIPFFAEIGLALEGRMMVDGEWAGRVTGVRDQSAEIAMMVTPDGHSRLELCQFHAPPTPADHRSHPANALGYQRIMFRVDKLDELLSRLAAFGAQVVDEVVRYGDTYRLCYIRGVEGLLIGLAEQLETDTAADILED